MGFLFSLQVNSKQMAIPDLEEKLFLESRNLYAGENLETRISESMTSFVTFLFFGTEP